MSNLFDYSTTPASNNSASPNGAPEGMSPSSANDIMRQMMANMAGAFTCYTATGSANAQVVTMTPSLGAASNKVRIAFIPVAANTGACTLNSVSIKMLDGTDPPAGALNSSGVALVQHNGTYFVLLNPEVSSGSISGSYTGTATGMTTSPTGTIYYRVVGNIVHLRTTANITGTSNANTFTITGAPAAIRPASNTGGMLVIATDNGQITTAYMTMNTSGTLSLTIPVFGVVWTTSGTKALQPMCASYMLTLPS